MFQVQVSDPFSFHKPQRDLKACQEDWTVMDWQGAGVFRDLEGVGCFQKEGENPPKWMVYNGTPYFLMDDLGMPFFWKHPVVSFNFSTMGSKPGLLGSKPGPVGSTSPN